MSKAELKDTGISEVNMGLGKGLYAYFETTEGDFIARLEEEKTPETTANFVGLASGTKEFTDPRDKAKKTEPFYDGTIFHRVIADFMLQGGDRTGTGMGGPGYRFKDEFHPSLKHTKPGLLSMANAGPGTNGSQFFVTLVPTPWLDNRHSIFGEVVKGMEVVAAMGATQTGHMDRPVKEMGIKKLRIFREK